MNILQCINNIEQSFPVNKWRIDDIDIWPIVRRSLFSENSIDEPDCSSPPKSKLIVISEEIKKVLLSLYAIIKDYRHNEPEHEADVVFLGFNADRTIGVSSGEMACQNLDAIKIVLQKREYSIYSLEYLTNFDIKIPRYTSSNLWLVVRIFIMNCLLKMDSYCGEVFLPCIDGVKAYLQQNGFKYSSCDESVIKKDGRIIKKYAEYFSKVISHTKARLGVVICWYSTISMAFLYACRKKGIRCIDVQHGAAGGNGHIAYSYWIDVPLGGYNIMPTNFWCWTDRDVSSIAEWYQVESKDINVGFVGGHFTQEYFVSTDESRRWNNIIRQRFRDDKILLLLTLQPDGNLPVWLVKFIKDTETKFQWLIRTHPIVDDFQKSFIEKIRNYRNVEYEVASRCPLGILLRECYMHITSHSAVVLDAEPYGVKSIILNEKCIMNFQDNINDGTCFYADDATSLNKILEGELANYKANKKVDKADSVDMSGVEQLIDLMK